MSKNSNHITDNQEIDLAIISKKIGGYYKGFNRSIFRGIQFIIRKIVIIGILFVLGIALGIYLDNSQKVYDNQVIVKPNFGSADYLYAKVALLNSKIKEQDTAYLKNIGIKYPKKLVKIKIEPVVDVYRFIDCKDENFQMLKLLEEDGDLKKIVEENLTSKNYPYHLISFTTRGMTSSDRTLNPLIAYFNESTYYKILQKQFTENTLQKMQQNEVTLKQIDAILNKIGTTSDGRNDRMVFNSGDSQLDDVLKTKDKMEQLQGYLKIELIEGTQIIKSMNNFLNKKNTESVNGKMTLILPFLFVILYILGFLFVRNYKKFNSKVKVK
mgnify:CR=1 FL=1